MKTNELSNELKKVYAKPEIEVEEMEVQWQYLDGGGGSGSNGGGVKYTMPMFPACN